MTTMPAADFVAAPRPPIGEPKPWFFPATEERFLDNGVRLVTCHLPGRDVITARLLIHAPLSGEPPGFDGIASVTANALTEGTRHRDGERFAVDVERLGATVNAFATYSTISLSVTAVASRFDAAFRLGLEALIEPALTERDVERLRLTQLDGLVQQRANPAHRAEFEVFTTLFEPGERIARPLVGTDESLAAITRDAVAAYHEESVSPSRCTVVLAGDLERLDIGATAISALATWTGGDGRAAVRAREPFAAEPRMRLVHRAGATQTELRIARIGITRHDPDWAALSVASYALGGSMMSRLMQVLREERGYTYGISARAHSLASTGTIVVGSAVETTVTGEAAAEALRLINDIATTGVTDDEAAFAVRNLGAAPRRLETSSSVVSVISEPIADGLHANWCREHFQRLDTVTPAAATAAAARLWGAPMSMVAVGDADLVRPQLEAIVSTPIDVVE